MNEVLSNIKERRSRRGFLDKSIPDDVINKIIEAGRYAPSALNKQPWKFIIITDKNTIGELSSIVKGISAKIVKFLPILKILKSMLRDEKIVGAIKKSASYSGDDIFFKAPLLIFIVSDKKEPYAVKDCAMASQNMMLYAHSVGIGSCYIGKADLLARSKSAKKIIGLGANHVIQAAVIFGYLPNGDIGKEVQRRTDNIINWLR